MLLMLKTSRAVFELVACEREAFETAVIVLAKLAGDKQVEINCAAADFVAAKGLYDSRLFIIDTDAAQITVDGNLNVSDEKLDLTIESAAAIERALLVRSDG